MKTNTREPNICIITTPRPMAAVVPLSNLVDIMYLLSNELHLITGNDGDKIRRINEIHCHSIHHEPKPQTIIRILNCIYLHLRISYSILKLKNVGIWIFYMGEGLLLPIFILRLLGKPIILCLAASSPKMIDSGKNINRVDKITKFLEITNYRLSNKIVLYSPNLIKEWNLEKYNTKILIAHEHFLDFNAFKIKKKLNERENLIGYIGRLSEEKGILNFIKAIPIILETGKDIKFFLGGDGQLKNYIMKYLEENKLNNKIKLVGWIPHKDLINYLNELKLIVLPSYTEGLPNIMLEAMACGTPILASSVGAIPDVIKDGTNGFIMENNSPECISRNVIRALDHPNSVVIAKNANEYVKKKFTYDNAIEKYRKILTQL